MTKEQLTSLAERVMGLTGPDNYVDAEIALATGWVLTRFLTDDYPCWLDPSGKRFERKPAYTADLNAAMSLVPEGWEPCLDAVLSARTNNLCEADLWHVETKHDGGGLPYQDHVKGKAKTLALALTAAALLARAAECGE